jgi:peptidoglycan-N-acetylglucosamine deacetylase
MMPVGRKAPTVSGILVAMSALLQLGRRARDAMYDALPPNLVIRRGPATARRVALTFDDGPDDMTEEYLDVLDRLDVPATFFIMGDRSTARPKLVREYVRRGHQVAGHGWDHQSFPDLSMAELRDQLRKTDAALGTQPTTRSWVRPPHGAVSARVIAQMLATGYTIALWSFDGKDYEINDADGLVARCDTAAIAPGEVLLFHEGQRWTLEALPRIVENLKAAGFECVTMADLFAV